MRNVKESSYGAVRVVERIDGKWGVADSEGNEIVPFGKYGWIDGFDHGLARVRTSGKLYRSRAKAVAIITNSQNVITDPVEIAQEKDNERELHPERFAKWGIINERGEEVLPVVYDNIWNFLGKNRYSCRVEKGNDWHEVYFSDLNPSLPPHSCIRQDESGPWSWSLGNVRQHYEEFAGTYAQDVAGYSDEDINDAFDGDPDAYWNID